MISRAAESDSSRLKVLSSIWQKEPFTKMDVVRKAHLSLPTVTNVLSDLEIEGYVVHAGDGASRGGRPPTLYRFNPRTRYVIGAQIHINTISVGLIDLFENAIDIVEFPFTEDATAEYVVTSLIEGTRKLLSAQGASIEKLLGIGLGIPGFVNLEKGVWLNFPWSPAVKDIPLRSLLEHEFHIPVFMRNDINVCAEAELRYGPTPTDRDMLLVTSHEGLKASVVVDGQILTGKHGIFGSVGHLIVEENGLQCYCGTRGCLETYASGRAIRKLVAQRPDILRLIGGDPGAENLSYRIFERARGGCERCQEVVESFLPYMARAFASMIRFTDIYTLVLLGIYVEGGDYLRNRLYTEISMRLPDAAKANLSIYLGGKHGIDKILAAAAVPLIRAHLGLSVSPGMKALRVPGI